MKLCDWDNSVFAIIDCEGDAVQLEHGRSYVDAHSTYRSPNPFLSHQCEEANG